jgi:hypothetical protein
LAFFLCASLDHHKMIVPSFPKQYYRVAIVRNKVDIYQTNISDIYQTKPLGHLFI